MGGVIVLGLAFAAWYYRVWKATIVGFLFVLLGAFLSSGWWFVRNILVYGDPMAWDAVLFANQGLLRSEPLSWMELYHYAGGILDSYWASFGYGGVGTPSVFYIIVNLFLLIALANVNFNFSDDSEDKYLVIVP